MTISATLVMKLTIRLPFAQEKPAWSKGIDGASQRHQSNKSGQPLDEEVVFHEVRPQRCP